MGRAADQCSDARHSRECPPTCTVTLSTTTHSVPLPVTHSLLAHPLLPVRNGEHAGHRRKHTCRVVRLVVLQHLVRHADLLEALSVSAPVRVVDLRQHAILAPDLVEAGVRVDAEDLVSDLLGPLHRLHPLLAQLGHRLLDLVDLLLFGQRHQGLGKAARQTIMAVDRPAGNASGQDPEADQWGEGAADGDEGSTADAQVHRSARSGAKCLPAALPPRQVSLPAGSVRHIPHYGHHSTPHHGDHAGRLGEALESLGSDCRLLEGVFGCLLLQ
mmetsp:Transcript_19699/g.56509  ORF Transcript_19699/g.56509 Transcript_19699/m.56509 type:complete len:272 (-) Transcript_19699:186-1001(-)